MVNVKLLYFPGCPNVAAARSSLREAFRRLEMQPHWDEVDITAPGAGNLAAFGSPTVLVNGVDVEPAPSLEGLSCRLYRTGMGAPSPEDIITALLSHKW